MSQLLDIVTNLEETQRSISQLEKAVVANPDTPSLNVMLASLYKRQQNLEIEFAKAADAQSRDVCSYRLFAEDGSSPSVRAFTSALGHFQAWFTLVYDAITNGPKRVNRLTAEALNATSFQYGYTFSGSIGLVMTLPNERLLLDETNLDRTFQTLLDMAQASSSDQIAGFAHLLGPATVRILYQWATDHIEAGLGADIDWRRDEEVRSRLFIQLPQIVELRRTIAETSDEVTEMDSVTGTLVGADINSRSFHITVDGGSEIRGKMSEAIGTVYAVELPKTYVARIRKTTKINYSTDTEDTDYFLEALETPTFVTKLG